VLGLARYPLEEYTGVLLLEFLVTEAKTTFAKFKIVLEIRAVH